VVVEVGFLTVLRIHVPVRSMTMPNRSVIVSVAVTGCEVLPSPYAFAFVSASVSNVDVCMRVFEGVVVMILEIGPIMGVVPSQPRSSHGY